MSIQFPEPARISRLQLPERKAEIGMSLREGERVLEVNASKHQNLVDLTYADTKRFPAPDYAIKAFTEAATAGGLSYTAYRGGKSTQAEVLSARRAELEARLQALQLEAETARLWARLTFLIPREAK